MIVRSAYFNLLLMYQVMIELEPLTHVVAAYIIIAAVYYINI